MFTPKLIAGFYIAELGLFSQVQFFVKILNDNYDDNYIAKTTKIFFVIYIFTAYNLYYFLSMLIDIEI